MPILADWRLRECDYGALNGQPAADLHRDRRRYLDDLPLRWAGARVLVIGHVATRWAFDHALKGMALEDMVDAEFSWREGWEYTVVSSQ